MWALELMLTHAEIVIYVTSTLNPIVQKRFLLLMVLEWMVLLHRGGIPATL